LYRFGHDILHPYNIFKACEFKKTCERIIIFIDQIKRYSCLNAKIVQAKSDNPLLALKPELIYRENTSLPFFKKERRGILLIDGKPEFMNGYDDSQRLRLI